jgi:DivIVA domain-containing protein
MDRDAIERRDFPVGRRGYDPAAVDAHLRRVADEMDSLRDRTRGLSAGTSDQVREILEAAERSAVGIREQAGRDAGEHVARVSEAAAAMTSRIDQLQRELDGLLEALRASGRRLEEGLARLQEDVGGAAGAPAEEDHAAAAPAVVDPAPAIDEPADAAAFPAAAAPAGDEAGARLIALNMALGGTPRDETARYLAEHYELADVDALLDDVYRRAGT